MSHTQQEQWRGIQLMLLGVMLLLPMMDAAAKMLGESLASGQIVLARFAFQSLFLLPFVWKSLHWPKGLELKLHWLRALSLCTATLCFFTAIQVMPLADALAIFFVMPLLVTLLAPWVLGESVGWRRVLAALVGLVGAMVIIGPSRSLFGWHAVLPLITALGFAFYLIFTRLLARSGGAGGVSPLTMQFYSGVFGAILMALVLVLAQPLQWPVFTLHWPDAWQWRQLVLVGFLAAVGHLAVTSAFKYADASVLVSFQYMELVAAALLGWWLFGDIPSSTTWLGSAILVASGLYVAHRERLQTA